MVLDNKILNFDREDWKFAEYVLECHSKDETEVVINLSNRVPPIHSIRSIIISRIINALSYTGHKEVTGNISKSDTLYT